MLGGFDTTATTLTTTCFQLARNADIQEKLYNAIAAKMEDYVSAFFNIVFIQYSVLKTFVYYTGRRVPWNGSGTSLPRSGHSRGFTFLPASYEVGSTII